MRGYPRPVPGPGPLAACCLAVLLGFPVLPGAVELASVNWQGSGSGNLYSAGNPMISDDGRFVVFVSHATDLVPLPDPNDAPDVFVRDRLARTTTLVSVTADGSSAGEFGSGEVIVPKPHVFDPAISGNGRVVAFSSAAGDLHSGDDNGNRDIFARDLATGITELISARYDGTGPGNHFSSGPVAVSRDGRYVFFYSFADDLVPPGTPQSASYNLFLRDRTLGTTEVVNLDAQDAPLHFPGDAEMSDDGRRVVFVLGPDCYVRDLAARTTFHVPAGSPDPPPECRITGDGSRVFFVTKAQLDPGDQNAFNDNYYQDLASGTVVPAAPDPDGQLRGGSHNVAFSDDGRYFYFSGVDAFVPGDENGLLDLIRRDLATGVNELVSWNYEGNAGAGGMTFTRIGASGDGRWVAWRSDADDLVPDDGNGRQDIFARDMARGATLRVTAPWAAGPTASTAFSVALSTDGGTAIYVTDWDFLPGDVNGMEDVFVGEAAELFRDGFESGGTGRWSAAAE